VIGRTGKLLLAVGLMIGLCAIALAWVGGSHFRWTSESTARSVDIQIESVGGTTVAAMGAVSIIALVLGGVCLARSKQISGGLGDISAAGAEKFSFMTFIQRVRKSAKDCQLGGVCGGLGEHTPIPSWIWRMVFLVLLFCFGTGVLAYVILWICLPAPIVAKPANTQRDRSTSGGIE